MATRPLTHGSQGLAYSSRTAPEAPSAAMRRRLVTAVARLAPQTGANATPWPGLTCFRATRPTLLSALVYEPSLVLVVQGSKVARVATRALKHDAMRYLIAGVPVPAYGRIVKASPQSPFLSVMLTLDTAAVRDVMTDLPASGTEPALMGTSDPLRISIADAHLLDAVARFLEALSHPAERRVVAPGCMREIVYRLLIGEQGDRVRLATGLRPPAGVVRALHYARRHALTPVTVGALARAAGMSASSLHAAFRQATGTTPMQYIKRLRLERARDLLVGAGLNAADTAERVGYASPSQFTRDFKRVYGLPPRQYATSPRSRAR